MKRTSARNAKRQQAAAAAAAVVAGDDEEDEKRTRLGTGVVASAGGIFKSAAVAVLKRERKLMTTGEITKCAIETGLIKCQGKTPEATMASALYTDVKRKLNKSVFTRPQEGLFGLRQWIVQGFYPENWVGPKDGEGLAPFKRRAVATPVKAARSLPGRASKANAYKSWRSAASGDEAEAAAEEAEDADPEEEFEEAEEEFEEAEEEFEEEEEEEEEEETEAHEPSTAEKQRISAVQPSPRPSASGKRQRHSRAGEDEDDPISPLHMLGNAAASKSRERKRPGRIDLPDRDVGTAPLVTPKSPYEDPLAALHEVAISPMTYSQSGLIEKRNMPKISVDVDAAVHDEPGNGAQPTALPSLATPGSLLHALDTPSLLNSSPFAALTNPAMALLTSRGGPLLLNLASPNAANNAFLQSLAGLDTPSLLSLPLPERLPSTPADLLSASLLSPGLGGLLGLTSTPGASALAAAARARAQGGLPEGRISNSGALLINMNKVPAASADSLLFKRPSNPGNQGAHIGTANGGSHHHAANGAAGSTAAAGTAAVAPVRTPSPHQGGDATAPAPVSGGGPTPLAPAKGGQQQGRCNLEEIAKMQAVVERLESRLGLSNPQVGKAWLALAKMYESAAANGAAGPNGSTQQTLARAAAALDRARQACSRYAEACGAQLQCGGSFDYLSQKLSNGTAAPAQAAPAPASVAAT